MIDWEVTTAGLRVSDHRAAVEIAAPDWGEFYAGGSLPRPVDTTVSGQVSKLGFGTPRATVTSLTGGDTYTAVDGSTDLPTDSYLLDVPTPIETAVRFDGPATIHAPDRSLELSFGGRQSVTLGFRSQFRGPESTIRIPPTPAGFARALSHLHAGFETTRAAKSIPALRGHPPRIEFADAVEIPDAVADATAETGIGLCVPADLETILTVSPLAYYLQAHVSVERGATPTITAPGLTHRLDGDLPEAVASVLRRTFYLDCCCREAGPTLAGLPDPETLGIASARLSDPVRRFAAYLELDDESRSLPEWHLATYVPAEAEAARALPYALDRLSLIQPPKTGPLDGRELLRRSLTDFYRRGDRTAASVDAVRPVLGPARSHAWLDETTPIDVFNARTEAFENGLSRADTGGRLPFVVVQNDPEMGEEYAEVARIYEDHAADLPIDITVHRQLTCEELSTVFERPSAFVHYVGHCDTEGLRCTDGNLSAESIPECNARTFFLNACGSFYEGKALVERGSVAGGVTFSKVLNEQAAAVGTTFARLLVYGFSIDRAMQLARRQIMMGKNYAVVGDGTHVLGGRRDPHPGTLLAEPVEEGVSITYDVLPNWTAGGWYRPAGIDNERPHLYGTATESTLDREAFLAVLESINAPVIYDGQFFWPEELLIQLRSQE
ncbi:hypothetical protein [Halalkalicoccus jeotgali]|uniref:Uncharacterized protein n=1 Tax=Halalkalicoccus jeotgali (strain DSM 18796 / CECT 7217 / JCM 14584 / KCTC 4019 / B3) TaxID=795797 RepID=D8J371_HALJB|nr:hypothetical protein [Halalkalicoccus jeotgali]ADJ15178.1 hypothetical protein HacjB3_08975 [Halalkalicoccus jeotgali B3]ELY35102.1 hypothetical protein C497_13705 [Halalkalicoccus jeotgali B3]